MIAFIHRRWFDALGVFIGMVFALLATPLLVETTRYFQDWYDEQNPPAEMKGYYDCNGRIVKDTPIIANIPLSEGVK